MLRVPTSSYRIQLHAGFTFADAGRILPYLKDLGISHVYCSPYMQAAKGSMHGYDVVDQQQVNKELGGEEGHSQFVHMLKQVELGQLLDIVPNHMATGAENRYWWDVLENGPSSRFAGWFDIDWNSIEVKLQNKVLIPVLGDQYGHVLNKHEIAIHYDGAAFTVRYFDHVFPLAPRSLAIPLSTAARYINVPILNFIADSLARLPAPDSTAEDVQAARHRDKTILYDLLQRTCKEQPDVPAAIMRAVDETNRNVEALDTLLNLQNYRLAYWRTADQELGYRRFFDVNTLIGVRVERPRVFNETHFRVLEWLRNGDLDGVRVDHPDGLRDPEQYFERLRNIAPQAWILAEKILQPGELLRPDWPIAGTTGYDSMNICNQMLVNGEGLTALTQIYSTFISQTQDFDSLVHTKKLNVQHDALAADVNRLTQLFVEICENNRDRRDYTRAEIRRAIREVAAGLAVYRTYVVPERNAVADEDVAQILNAIEKAKTQRADIDADLFDFIADVLALRSRGDLETEFLERFQQYTSPVMAKGVEDTTFYCYNRMIGLNEVGGSPEINGISMEQFHAHFEQLQAAHPQTMNALSTHDTKRSDDVRARLAVLTEIPSQWRSALLRWSRKNQCFKTEKFPDRNTEYFLYQTLIGAWPISIERVTTYMEKAVREAKENTSWTQQNKEFEDALKLFIERLYASQEFIAELENFVAGIIAPGRINSLAQTLIKCTAPGIPDAYQGSEIWDLRLVDPDNRGDIDYQLRRSLLDEIQSGIGVDDIMEKADSGMPKLWVIYKALQLRREHPEWFSETAGYVPLSVEGSKQSHLVAFLRGENVAVLTPRWNVKLASAFGSTTVQLPAGCWTNILTGERVNGEKTRAQNLFRSFPVALLVKQVGEMNASI